MAEAAIYIACAPKSNSVVKAIGKARQEVRDGRTPPPPLYLRDAHSPAAKKIGHGEGYKYPHDFPGGFVQQQYLPEGVKRRGYYEPSDHGREGKIKERMERLWRGDEENE